MWNAAHNFVAS